MSKAKPERLKFKHNWPNDYEIRPVNGAWGGVSGRGDFIIHFFVERHDVPEFEIQEVYENGSVGPVIREAQEEQEIVRDMQVGIMVNREQAVSIANWMLKKVEEFEKIQKEELEEKKEK